MNAKRGFTLIELLVVVSIMGMLASIVLASLSKAREKAHIAVLLFEVRQLDNAARVFNADTNQYPAPCYIDSGGCTSANDPFINSLGVPNWKGPYFKIHDLSHFWGGQIGWDRNDLDNDTIEDYYIILDDDRMGTNGSDDQAQIPQSVLLAIDNSLDDGNLTTGWVRGNNYSWGTAFVTTGELIIRFRP